MHWIGAQFCLCMFLDSIDNSVNMLKFDLVTKSAYNSQNTQFGLPGRTMYTLGYCPCMHLLLYAFILSHIYVYMHLYYCFIFALQQKLYFDIHQFGLGNKVPY